MAAAAMLPGDVAGPRSELRALLLPRQQRIHFTHEKPARRRQILAKMCALDVQVHVYVARTRDHIPGRRACMKAILDDVLAVGAHHLVFELDEPVKRSDRRLIAERFRLEADPPQYRHLQAKSEPLLWISDAVAWCHQRGGEWRPRCASLVRGVREV